MNFDFSGYSWMISTVTLLMSGVSCGLPDYSAVNPPTAVAVPDSYSTAFRTPADDQFIQGYHVYYKIYTNDSDYNLVGREDEEKFTNETLYTSNELPGGRTVPKQQGFFKIGTDNEANDVSGYTIPHAAIGPDTVVYIDFSDQTAIVYTDVAKKTPIVKLKRGVLDYNQSGGSLLDFFADWDFIDSDADDYTDADLYRNTNTSGFLDYQPVQNQTDMNSIKNNGTPLTSIAENPLEPGTVLLIGIAVYASGTDIQTLKPLDSTPAHLGYITDAAKHIHDKDRD